ncbi:MAG: ferritin-like domain-containing protein [Bacillota bacterium]
MEYGDHDVHRREGYADPAPYPEIRVAAPNMSYAQLLMDDYAGAVSEFTAINQYLYHHFVTEESNKEVGKLLENVAITEMRHMEMIAGLILLLGGNPVFRGSTYLWNPRMVYYGNDFCSRLKADLDAEQKAIQNYQIHISRIDDPYIQSVLGRIILDERVHLELFKQAIEKYCQGQNR